MTLHTIPNKPRTLPAAFRKVAPTALIRNVSISRAINLIETTCAQDDAALFVVSSTQQPAGYLTILYDVPCATFYRIDTAAGVRTLFKALARKTGKVQVLAKGEQYEPAPPPPSPYLYP